MADDFLSALGVNGDEDNDGEGEEEGEEGGFEVVTARTNAMQQHSSRVCRFLELIGCHSRARSRRNRWPSSL
jgi:hypothetical protein